MNRPIWACLFASLSLAGCSNNHVASEISCGAGTFLQGDVCVPSDGVGQLVCGEGTHEEESACVPNASALSCGEGTERQGFLCVALDATHYEVRLPDSVFPADGYSKIPVLAIGRLTDGSPATDEVVFSLSRPNGGSFAEAEQTLTSMGIVTYLTPCNSVLSPTCAGSFTVTLALAQAPQTLVARSIEATLVSPTGVGSAAACLGGGNVLFLNGDNDDSVHPGTDIVGAGAWTAASLGGNPPNRVTVTVEPSSSALGAWWTTTFSSEDLGQALLAQVYGGAERVDYTPPGHPGLEVRSATTSCNTLTGSFEIVTLEMEAANSVPKSFTATFEQHCDGGTSALRGCVHFAR